MPDTSITSQVHQPLDIHRYFPSQVPFRKTPTNFRPYNIQFRLSQVSYNNIRLYPCSFTYFHCPSPTDAINMHQCNPQMFPVRYVNSRYACHIIMPFPQLPSIVFRRVCRFQPCRCLCLGSLQMIRTVLFLRTTLQFRHSRFTDALTFTFGSCLHLSCNTRPAITLQIRLFQQTIVLM